MVTPYDFCSCSRTASPEKDTTTSVVIIHPFKNGTMRAMITVPSFIDAVPLFSYYPITIFTGQIDNVQFFPRGNFFDDKELVTRVCQPGFVKSFFVDG